MDCPMIVQWGRLIAQSIGLGIEAKKYKTYILIPDDPNNITGPSTQQEVELDLFVEKEFSKLLRELQLANDKYSTRAFLKQYGNRRILNRVDSTEGDYTMNNTEFYNFYDKYVDKLDYDTV